MSSSSILFVLVLVIAIHNPSSSIAVCPLRAARAETPGAAGGGGARHPAPPPRPVYTPRLLLRSSPSIVLELPLLFLLFSLRFNAAGGSLTPL